MPKPNKLPQPKVNGDRVVFPCRLSYSHLDKPWAADTETEPKFSVCCIIPKSEKEAIKCIREAEAAAEAAGIAGIPTWKGQKPRNLKSVIHDGSEREGEEYQDAIYFSASSKKEVPVLNRLKEDIDPAQAYSGCWAMVSVRFYPFGKSGNNGISAGLNAVVKLADDDRLGGFVDSRKDFDDIDFGTDDMDLDDMM